MTLYLRKQCTSVDTSIKSVSSKAIENVPNRQLEAIFLFLVAYNAYYKFYNNLMELFMKPHLVIYLDAPTGVVTENLKKRGQGEEKAVTPEFLEVMDEKYKFKFLKDIEEHAEVLIYDWSVPGDVEVVVEDIERIDFDKYDRHEADKHHPKMKDWRWEFEWDANEARWRWVFALNP